MTRSKRTRGYDSELENFSADTEDLNFEVPDDQVEYDEDQDSFFDDDEEDEDDTGNYGESQRRSRSRNSSRSKKAKKESKKAARREKNSKSTQNTHNPYSTRNTRSTRQSNRIRQDSNGEYAQTSESADSAQNANSPSRIASKSPSRSNGRSQQNGDSLNLFDDEAIETYVPEEEPPPSDASEPEAEEAEADDDDAEFEEPDNSDDENYDESSSTSYRKPKRRKHDSDDDDFESGDDELLYGAAARHRAQRLRKYNTMPVRRSLRHQRAYDDEEEEEEERSYNLRNRAQVNYKVKDQGDFERDQERALLEQQKETFNMVYPATTSQSTPARAAPAVTAADLLGLPQQPQVVPREAPIKAQDLDDPDLNFDKIGGLGGHILRLKEMVMFPILYPDIPKALGIEYPKGVLFHGPPGTGKTLMAKALAATCNRAIGGPGSSAKVSFYVRKGSDLLSKWVGEAERQLRQLFDEAKAHSPAIIFFDEIDGIAPARKNKADDVSASVVSTLLALMDGLDSRGQVVVIGATNRPDTLDPALRRPGRFDRELFFPLPDTHSRRQIIDINTAAFNLPDQFKDELVQMTDGYGGADIRALCVESALTALRRCYPQIYLSDLRLAVDPDQISVLPHDFFVAYEKLVPSTARADMGLLPAPLPDDIKPLLEHHVRDITERVSKRLPPSQTPSNDHAVTFLQTAALPAKPASAASSSNLASVFAKFLESRSADNARFYHPRLLVYGAPGMGQTLIPRALFHSLSTLPVETLDLPRLLAAPEDTCRTVLTELRRQLPAILYIPDLALWESALGETTIQLLLGMFSQVPLHDPLLVLALIDVDDPNEFPSFVSSFFGANAQHRAHNYYHLAPPGPEPTRAFLMPLVSLLKTPPSEFSDAVPDPDTFLASLEELPEAPPPQVQQTAPKSPQTVSQEILQDNRTMELFKFYLRNPLLEMKKKYKSLNRSLYDTWLYEHSHRDPTSNPYVHIDLEKVHRKLNAGEYWSLEDMARDLDAIVANHALNDPLETKAQDMRNFMNVTFSMIDPNFLQDLAAMSHRMHERQAAAEKEAAEAAESQVAEPIEIDGDDPFFSAATQQHDTSNGAAEDQEPPNASEEPPLAHQDASPNRAVAQEHAVTPAPEASAMAASPTPSTPTPAAQNPRPLEEESHPAPETRSVDIDDAALQAALDEMFALSQKLNVEELLELRAHCFALAYEHRLEWDRTRAVDEIRHFISFVSSEACSSTTS